MLFNSYTFIFVFLPVALVGFYLAARLSRRAAVAWLVLCSFGFYAWWNAHFVLLLAGSIAFNYTCSRLIAAIDQDRARLRGGVLAAGIAANLLLLCFYKYLFPLLDFLDLTGSLPPSWAGGVILPLGISFFTFTQIGYLIDAKEGLGRDHGPLDYMLFVTFFPHLIAGPILHNREIIPQFANPATYRFRPENLSLGLSLFAIGLFKKVVIADPLGQIIDPGFASPAALGTFGAWQTALGYSMQLYFDFSGYCDMAIGIARMFGVRFPLNFDSPYKARSVIDFWQRWHMTLTRYLTLYIYNPIALAITRRRMARGLGVSRQATRTLGGFSATIALPVLITMALAGVWHGAGLQFIVFGLLHALYLSVNHAWRVFGPRPRKGVAPRRTTVVACVLLTYLSVLLAQIFFRAGSVGEAGALIGGMLGLHPVASAILVPARLLDWSHGLLGPLARHGLVVASATAYDLKAWTRIVLAFAIVWSLPNSQQILASHAPALGTIKPSAIRLLTWQPNAGWGVAVAALLLASLFNLDNVTRFLYFQF
ncbi:MAG: MBOAT family O-acyltransferase [Acetobacteraceae bacterium]|nr:MBOAT family O-acyltransferase [Acetobacteraceae bacterium]